MILHNMMIIIIIIIVIIIIIIIILICNMTIMMINLQSAHLGCGIEAWDEAGHPVTGHHHLHSSHHHHHIIIIIIKSIIIIIINILIITHHKQASQESLSARHPLSQCQPGSSWRLASYCLFN